MEAIKKIVNVLAMLYLIGVVLVYLDVLNIGQDSYPNYNTILLLVGGGILLLELIVENLYIASLKRGHVHTQHKINELKALLYDQKQEMQQYKTARTDAPVVTPVTSTRPAPDNHPGPSSTFERGKIIVTPSSGTNDPNRRRPDSSDTL
jgi:hypothetical protein